LVVFIGVLLLFIPEIGVPLDFGCLFLFYAAIALDTVRLVRWRRQYETSISRLFQSASGCENPLKTAGSTKGMATGTEGTGLSNGDVYFPETFLGDAWE